MRTEIEIPFDILLQLFISNGFIAYSLQITTAVQYFTCTINGLFCLYTYCTQYANCDKKGINMD